MPMLEGEGYFERAMSASSPHRDSAPVSDLTTPAFGKASRHRGVKSPTWLCKQATMRPPPGCTPEHSRL